MDYYQLLGLDRSASTPEIKKAYRRLAKEYHPDTTRNDPARAARFKEIQQAYEVLTDPEARAIYDRPPVTRKAKSQKPGDTGSLNEIFQQLKGLWKGKPIRGEDKEQTLSVTLAEAYNGAKRYVSVIHEDECDNCHGLGRQDGGFCPKCQGEGVLTIPKQLEVRIPPGVREGSKVRVRGEGAQGRRGGERGDLYLVVTVQPHHLFQLEDDGHVLLDLPVTPAEAALGCEVEVPTLSGRVKMKVPPQTNTGTVLRLKGKGLPALKENPQGDQLLKVRIVLNRGLGSEEQQLFKRLLELQKDDPRRIWKL